MEIAIDIYVANYGGVIKKRIANKNRGKIGSTRTIVAFKKGRNCYFMFGFEKDEKDNITQNEEKARKLIAKNLLSYSEDKLDCLIQDGGSVAKIFDRTPFAEERLFGKIGIVYLFDIIIKI